MTPTYIGKLLIGMQPMKHVENDPYIDREIPKTKIQATPAQE